ncbi:MAG TPA: hypothetical protein VHV31_12925 [Nitrolancea sp.]|jgi:polyphosphate kinase 2|nr:hypothetical protein [Nitrolancea sp.]
MGDHERQESGADPQTTLKKLGRKQYEKELARLQGELVQLQSWIVDEGLKVCIVFEGSDTAGKGGVIKRITERLSPRVFRVVALPKPTDRERSQMYVQRYLRHFPAAGEAVIFDRSWYNRAGIERVMGFCPEEEVFRFLRMVPLVEHAMVESGIILLKYWLEVGEDEQTRRLRSRIDDPRKLSWHLADSNDKKRARLNIIGHLLEQIPSESPPRPDVKLPPRQKRTGYIEPDHSSLYIPARY